MFPTIFSLGIRGLGPHREFGSGILCTAIVGGAIIPPLYGKAADYFGAGGDTIGYQWAFVIPILCYIYILFFSIRSRKMAATAH